MRLDVLTGPINAFIVGLWFLLTWNVIVWLNQKRYANMGRPYLILVNNVLWDRKLTLHGAKKVCAELQAKGLQAVVGYDIQGGN